MSKDSFKERQMLECEYLNFYLIKYSRSYHIIQRLYVDRICEILMRKEPNMCVIGGCVP